MAGGGGKIQKKVLLLLYAGLSLTLASGSPGRLLKVLKMAGKEWEKINREALLQAIKSLYRSSLIDFKELGGGKIRMILSKSGKSRVLEFDADNLKIKKPLDWDGKWRIVIFDIPKDMKKAREVLRFHLKKLGFYGLQKSVFVLPFPCWDEIEFLVELYDLKPFVRQVLAIKVDNELHLRKMFALR
ncbi:MAG: CRISPR-associated endonuclease Cas2 [Patescibacteria group bacterium]